MQKSLRALNRCYAGCRDRQRPTGPYFRPGDSHDRVLILPNISNQHPTRGLWILVAHIAIENTAEFLYFAITLPEEKPSEKRNPFPLTDRIPPIHR